MEIKVIVFDLGNVLIPFDYNRLIANLNYTEEGLGERFYKKYKENYEVHRKFETWELSNEEFLEIMMEWTESKITKEHFCNIYADLFTTNDDVIELLPLLKKNYKLYLLSNTNFIHQKYGWEKYDFLENFDKLILSHEVGSVKPNKIIYKAVEAFTSEASAAHIFIDDVLDYCHGAEKCGWKSINFTNYKNLVNSFKEHNIIL